MLFCPHCGRTLPNTSAVCECRVKPAFDDGGPAYPQFTRTPLPYGASHVEAAGGLSLRDWFAGQALAGLMSDPGLRPDNVSEFQHMAARLYQVADAMLAERAKEGR